MTRGAVRFAFLVGVLAVPAPLAARVPARLATLITAWVGANPHGFMRLAEVPHWSRRRS